MLFADNIGPSLSIDETALSNGELYTIVTNKEAKGGKRAIVAMLKGTQAEQIMAVLERIPIRKRNRVREVTMDMAANMIKAIRGCFSNASRAIWYNDVESAGIDAFKTVARSVQTHYESILNFFDNRSTNASAESFNAKIKAFRLPQKESGRRARI